MEAVRDFVRGHPFLMIYSVVAVCVALLLVWIASLVDPSPPRHVRMATGPAGGAYAAAGDAFAAALADSGVTVELIATTGSLANLDRLGRSQSDGDHVDIAIVQGGLSRGAAGSDALSSLGGVFLEPVWVFARAEAPVFDLRDLAGRTWAVGAEGSGVRAMARLLLAENGLTEEGDVAFDARSGAVAAQALKDGEVDAVLFVTSVDRPYVRDLLSDPDIAPMSFARAPAYARRHRFLSDVVLPRGAIDLAIDAPPMDVALIAPAADLVVRRDLHPAIHGLLLQAATAEFRAGDLLAAPGTFPNRDLASAPLSREAERWYERGGPSFLRRYLPFWAANLVDRLWVLAIPALTLLYPLAKAAPPLYRWQVKRRIIRWYRDLRELEIEGRAALNDQARLRVRRELRRILGEVGEMKVPLTYNDDVYRLRSHIRLVDALVDEGGSHAHLQPLADEPTDA